MTRSAQSRPGPAQARQDVPETVAGDIRRLLAKAPATVVALHLLGDLLECAEESLLGNLPVQQGAESQSR